MSQWVFSAESMDYLWHTLIDEIKLLFEETIETLTGSSQWDSPPYQVFFTFPLRFVYVHLILKLVIQCWFLESSIQWLSEYLRTCEVQLYLTLHLYPTALTGQYKWFSYISGKIVLPAWLVSQWESSYTIENISISIILNNMIKT